MTSEQLEVRVLITELPTSVEKKSKQTDLNDTPEPMLLPINDHKVLQGHLNQCFPPFQIQIDTNLCMYHVISTSHQISKLVLNICYDFFSSPQN